MATVKLEDTTQNGPATPGRTSGLVKNFTLDIADNQFLALLGPSGCGKSTILRMIAGLESPLGGRIFIGGKDVSSVPPKDRDVAIVFPGDTLLPHLTVRENLALGLNSRNLTKAEADRRINNASDLLDLSPFLELKAGALRPAQRLRIALGRAVAQQPKVFLFDDPLAQLSPPERELMRRQILKLHQQLQSTMVLATSAPRDAMALSSRLVVLGSGNLTTVEQSGPPLEVYSSPANRFVAGLVAEHPMNILNGMLRKDGEEIIFKEPPGGTLEIRLGRRPAASEWLGKDVVLGLRPEDCEILPAGKTPQENAFQVLADIVETFGDETHFHADTGAHKIIITSRSAPNLENAGHRIRILVNSAKAQLFDPTTGKAIR